MSKEIAAVGVVAAIGIAAYLYLNKSKNETPDVENNSQGVYINPNTITTSNSNVDPIPTFIRNEQEKLVLNPDAHLTADVVTQIRDVIPDVSNNAILNILHGQSVEDAVCAYRGTNFKCYSSYEEALANGAAH